MNANLIAPTLTINMTVQDGRVDKRQNLVDVGTRSRLACTPILKPESGVFQRKTFLPTALLLTMRIILRMIRRMNTRLIVCAIPPDVEVVIGLRCDPKNDEDLNGAMMCDLTSSARRYLVRFRSIAPRWAFVDPVSSSELTGSD